MKKACPYWKEYESLNGPVAYCEAAAFNKTFARGYLEKTGCTADRREECRRAMVACTGFGLVPVDAPGHRVTAGTAAEKTKLNRGVEKMKKTVDCLHWNEYEGLNGKVMFCAPGAYGKGLTAGEAASCGCTSWKRDKCLKMITENCGFGLVPDIAAALPAGAAVEGREEFLGIAG